MPLSHPEVLSDWMRSSFEHAGKRREVYRRGSGPGVLVMHEIPGLHPSVVRFANEVVAAGFTVFLPDLFGVAGRKPTPLYTLGAMARACVSREFSVLAAHGSSPICDWLRALARSMHVELGGPGIGALGMCLTGNFALALMLEPALIAPVLCQPSLPFPLGAERRAALHLSPAELDNLRRRAREGCPVLGLRFTRDFMSPPERFATLRRELGERFEGIEIDSDCVRDSINPSGPHSVLSEDFRDEAGHPTVAARDRVLAFFRSRLLASH